jgi:hypothetical protein
LRSDLGQGVEQVMGAGRAATALLPGVFLIALDVKIEQSRIRRAQLALTVSFPRPKDHRVRHKAPYLIN